MSLILLATLFALLVWWAGTGLVIYLDGLPPRTFRWSMAGATVLLGVGLVGAYLFRADSGTQAVYLSFGCGFLVWAWQEVSFYTGYVTGPRKQACQPGCAGWRHFGHALGVSLWHEIAIVVSALALWFATAGGPNRVAFWSFVILWVMHESARINVFLGVRNLSEEFLPEHLSYLRSFLRKRTMNPLFPFAVTGATVLAVLLLQQALAAPDAGSATAWGLLAGLALLGVLEHWFLVLPLPFTRLWHWGLASRNQEEPLAKRETATGSELPMAVSRPRPSALPPQGGNEPVQPVRLGRVPG